MAETDTVTGLQLRSTAKTGGILEISLAQVEAPPPVAPTRSPCASRPRQSTRPIFGSCSPAPTSARPPRRARESCRSSPRRCPSRCSARSAPASRSPCQSETKARESSCEAGVQPGGAGAARQEGRRCSAARCSRSCAEKQCRIRPGPAAARRHHGRRRCVRLVRQPAHRARDARDDAPREDHTALVHTAAASNLGQMLVRLCLKDGVPLVNIVRKPEQGSSC